MSREDQNHGGDELLRPLFGSGDERPPVAKLGLRPPQATRVLAIAGAKGGVGTTLLSVNFALYLATIGRRVVLIDAAMTGANAHTFLGMQHPIPRTELGAYPFAFGALYHGLESWPPLEEAELMAQDLATSGSTEVLESSAPLQETPIQGLSLLRAQSGLALRQEGELSYIKALHASQGQAFEYAVADLGAGSHPRLLQAWSRADLPLLVVTPEPTAVERSYRWICWAFLERLRAALPDGESRRSLRERLRRMPMPPAPLDLVTLLQLHRDPCAKTATEILETFRMALVLNKARVRADLELGEAMRRVVKQRLGLSLDYLGYIDHDDAVWSSLRVRRPLLVESPAAKASRSIEKIARRLSAAEPWGAGKQEPQAPPNSHHTLLDVERGASEEEIRRAYRRAKEVYAKDAMCCYGLYDAAELEALGARLDEAYDVLLDPARRRPYELSIFSVEDSAARLSEGPPLDRSSLPPPPLILPDTDFDGPLLREVRESRGIELHQISRVTKIGVPYLAAIENEDLRALPAPVYVRGFVRELAKCLDLDPEQVTLTYMRKLKRAYEAWKRVEG